MTDYKELCAALREEAEYCQAIEWEIPICTEDHIRQAADVIEELVTKCQRLERERDAFMIDFKKGFEEQVHKKHGVFRCDICKYGGDYDSYRDTIGTKCPEECDGYNSWEWQGIRDDS